MTTPDWHTPAYPELRSTPPWVMFEMIEEEPSLAAPIAADPAAAELADAVRRARAADAPVVVTGCGTSGHAAEAVADLLSDALGATPGTVRMRQAFEAALAPEPRGLCIGISHEGETAATLEALAAARRAGAATALITSEPGARRYADLSLVTPLRDRSWCHTVGYLSPILAGAAVAASLGGSSLDGHAAEHLLVAALGLRGQAENVARELHGARQLACSGSGSDRAAARELALKVEEGARLPTSMRDLETMLHGHLAACDEHTAMVLIATDPRAAERRVARGHQLLRAARRLGVATAVIRGHGVPAFGAELASAGELELPPAGRVPALLAGLLAGAVALQLLTLALVHEAGVNPDLIRRDQAPWREAAALAGE
jgi:fructoselysine-6-P-deglycase FrlB-like protein